MTTIHCYTGSQPMVDAPRGPDLARNRAGAVSMVPTTTSAAKLIDRVLPDLAGRVTGAAVRVPAISVSAVDLVVRLTNPPSDPADALRAMANANPVIGLVEDACVSVDLRARTESLVIAPNETMETGDQIRIFGWYDNEWGFSARMLDVARMMQKRAK
jgi:glyceraldehyde 3-phosphate dehydrogenase